MKDAFEHFEHIFDRDLPAIFLDFDGTLTEIAPRPDQVALSDSVRGALTALCRQGIPVAVVSGRDLDDLRRRVGLMEAAYAGSHGFDMLGPPPVCARFQPGIDHLSALDRVENALRTRLGSIPGIYMERKRFAFAVHYRQVAEVLVNRVAQAVSEMNNRWPAIQVRNGKKVFELLPNLPWDKGRAVLWVMEQMALEGTPIYVGDDLTDEDAFIALRDRGTGIVVQETESPSAAAYRLRNPAEVERFLWLIAKRFGA